MTATPNVLAARDSRRRIQRTLGWGFSALALLVVCVTAVFPLFWMLLVSLKEGRDVADPSVWFFSPILDHYIEIFTERNILRYLANSAIVSLSTTILSVTIGAFAAYGLARFRFRRSEDLAFVVLAMRMLPAIAIVIPLFAMVQLIGIFDTRLVLVICYMLFNIPFSIWMLRGFFEEIPESIEEAALIDGCTRTQVLWRIMLPLAAPGLAATSIFCIINSWNEFTFAVFLTSVKASTLPTTVTQFLSATGTAWGPMAATGVITIIPVLVFSLIVQRYMVKGLSFGGVK